MKAFPVVILVLLAFAAFFLTFLLAPLAVLALFYVVYAMRMNNAEKDAPPRAEPQESLHAWDVARTESEPDDEPAPSPAPARRARITVVSRTDLVVDEPVTDPDAPPADAPQAGGTTTPATPRTT